MKKNILTYRQILIFAAVSILTFPNFAQAYLDPGSGSYIIQLLFGALFGASYLVKVYWEKIKSFFSKSPTENPSSDNKDD